MADTGLLAALVDALRCMPGIGRKSAQRIAYHLLQRDRDRARHLSAVLQSAMDRIGHCRRCRTFSETELCALCGSNRRDQSLLCIVESPADVQAVEEAGYRGLYFVLLGRLSPLDGIGPEELGLEQLDAMLGEPGRQEVIVATNPTVEGEATAHYIGEMVRRRGLRVTRIAHGVPMGGELEYVDSGTIARALAGRREI
ncbi:MAG: recombination protein RecR [Gammaproteobacteria bacterium]|nr:recombination protein RecR [Gammaproteobacteria bacterium]